jgi:hypothetical protein
MQDILNRKEKPIEKPRVPFFATLPPPPPTLPPMPKPPVSLPSLPKPQPDYQPIDTMNYGKQAYTGMMGVRPGERLPMPIGMPSEQIRPFDGMQTMVPPMRSMQMPMPMPIPHNPSMPGMHYSMPRPMAVEQRPEIVAEPVQKISDSQRLKMLLKNKMKKE